MLVAITRAVSPAITRCELTYMERVPIDLLTARRQHRQYEAALRSIGVQVHPLPPEADLPDSVFVEDLAIVFDECAVMTRPGASSRRPEGESIARALAPYRKLIHVQAPATLDGGDVLAIGKDIYIGRSTRSNPHALEQVQNLLAPYGYSIRGIPIRGCLHLKSAVTQVADDTLLLNPAWVDAADFPGLKFIAVDPSEPYAANALRIGATVLYQPAFPKTRRLLEQAGIRSRLVDESELGKAEGALTCCSLIFRV
ncbi:MAG: dimethylargininase [Anaerolineales bacterium]|jgi:dimethylargininase